MFTNSPSPAPRCSETHRCDTTGLSEGDRILHGFGDDPEDNHGPHNPLRVFSQNVSGLKLHRDAIFFSHAVDFWNRFGADIVCISETNTNWIRQTNP